MSATNTVSIIVVVSVKKCTNILYVHGTHSNVKLFIPYLKVLEHCVQ